MKLRPKLVEKPWGRTDLPPAFGDASGRRIGEVWFTGAPGAPLLVKQIFTSERLSIQVHPNDAEARKRGHATGKEECWYILDAEPGAAIGLGLEREVSREELREAALDGSIEALMDWRPVRPGDVFYVPAGTVHAIGAGLSLIEIQQNADVTYRLYDYGRPRELHLDDGIAVALPCPYPAECAQHVAADEAKLLVSGPYFSLAQAVNGDGAAEAFASRRRWVIPLDGEATAGDERAGPGECLLVGPGEQLKLACGRALIATEGRADAQS